MASIKDLKKRITTTKNTQQTTKAMKLVSAAKLRRATDAILSQRPYAKEIATLMSALSDAASDDSSVVRQPVSLIVSFSSDRGLCGGYNTNVIKATSQVLNEKQAAGKAVKCVFVGKKVQEMIKLRYKGIEVAHYEEFGQKITFRRATELAKILAPMYDKGEVDEVIFVFNEFKNAITQEIKTQKVLPLAADTSGANKTNRDMAIFVPGKKELYEALASKYFTIQIFKSFLEAQASEHGARMGAMENATKNAGDMIRKLTLQYNKQRQAGITKELLEIIAGSESQKTA